MAWQDASSNNNKEGLFSHIRWAQWLRSYISWGVVLGPVIVCFGFCIFQSLVWSRAARSAAPECANLEEEPVWSMCVSLNIKCKDNVMETTLPSCFHQRKRKYILCRHAIFLQEVRADEVRSQLRHVLCFVTLQVPGLNMDTGRLCDVSELNHKQTPSSSFSRLPH